MSDAIRNKPLANFYRLINSEWPTTKFGSIFTESLERNGKIPKGEALSVSEYHGVIPRDDSEGQRASKEVSNYRVVYPNELAVNYMWLNRGGLGVSQYTGYISPAYKVFKIGGTLFPAYAHYLLRSQPYIQVFSALGTGVRPNSQMVDSTELNALPIPLPPLPTQRAIADYLDRETAEIDGMRDDLDEMERLLEERRSALIQQLIDQRIDADAVPMSIAVAGHLGGSGLVGGQSPAGDSETGILKTSAISSGRFLPSQNRLIEAEQVEKVPTEYFVRSGDLLFNRLNSPEYVGSMSYVGETKTNLIFSDKIWRLFPGPQTDPQYLAFWAKTPAYRKQVEFSIVGTSHSMQSLGYSTFQQFRVFLPPLAEQRRIADEIDRETAEIDSMLSDITKLRDLLAERRSAVISAAVTGQIDIPVSPTHKDEPHA
ncbi:restriction endonuclease subunit S [Corynebacterium striatum]|nr:hypothetical protein [Corynebacterium striatum]HAT1475545.1 hypothetical protein [Corynebacterium striatum]HAT6526539.1 hypothetical protein [Corynebacterium striatum]HAT6564673.1 hypothetical protein [Corynebacterium striatum]HAT6570086.1 hypothetical protein [Corynebacterium striatum]